METNRRPRTASARPGTDPFGRYRNSSRILERAKRSEGPKRAEGQYLLPSEEIHVSFCSNWFLMLIGSEVASGCSPDPSRAEPCRADLIRYSPRPALMLILPIYLRRVSRSDREGSCRKHGSR
jgi:hypothetical protein